MPSSIRPTSSSAKTEHSLPPANALSIIIAKTLAVGLFAALVSTPSYAADSGYRVNPLDRELDLQNKQRQQEEINRQLDKNQRDVQEQQLQLPEQPELPVQSGPTFLINTITVDPGDKTNPNVNVDDILEKYTGRELGNSDLFGLIRDVTNRYADKGFSTTTISLVPKNMKQGEVELKVNWGYVEGWLVNGQPPTGPYQKLLTASAMPNMTGKPLNIHQVDQMVENLNNAAKTARVDIQPSERVGYSFLNLVVQEKGLPSLTVRAENSGMDSPSKGRYRYSASTSISDLLLGNDTLGLNASSRRYQLSESNSDYSAGVSYSVPFGYSKVDLRFNHSQYEKRLTGGNYGNYDTSGDSQSVSAKFSHVLTRGKTDKLSASVELDHKKSANYIESALLSVSSLPYTSLGFGLEHVTQFMGGSLYSDATFTQGLSTWDSHTAAYDKNNQPKHFKKVAFNTAWSRPLKIADKDFSFSSRIGGQYSSDNLLVAQKMGLGDEFTVRGFRGPAIWGDQGIYISNTLTRPMQLLNGTVTPLIGVDAGHARDVKYKDVSGTIAGLALGVSGSWAHGGGSITLGLPMYMHREIRDSTDDAALYMSTYLTF